MGAKYTNGGIVKFTKRNTQIETKGNTVVFINDGDGSVGYALYKLDSFIGTVNIAAAYSEKINPYTGIFVATSANMLRSKYSFGYKRTLPHLKQDRIMLPKSPNNQPNWDYMEQYIVNIMKTIKVPILEPSNPSRIGLDTISWALLPISKIFDSIQRGKRLIKAGQQQGDIPYISSTALNNGVDNYISTPNKRYRSFANFIGINNSGSVGRAFYHEYTTIVSDHVTALSHRRLNKYNAAFLIACIEQSLHGNFSFNREISDNRLVRQKIMIPLSDDGNINWQFMEDYIKSISNSHLI